MRKTWVQPQLLVEQFVPNEYVSTCGKTESGKYLFTCDAPAGNVYYYPNGTTGRAKWLGGYEPCGAKHETDSPDYFYDGFVDYNRNGKEDSGESKLIWVESNGYYVSNWHASASLSRDMIEVARS